MLWEYNRTRQKLVCRHIVGGVETQQYISPAAIGDCNTGEVRLRITYDDATGDVHVGAYRSSGVNNYYLATFAIGFTPANYGVFSRIMSPSASTLTTRWRYAQAFVPWIGGADVCIRSGSVWVPSSVITPSSPRYAPTYAVGKLSHNGNWFAMGGSTYGIYVYEHDGVGGFTHDALIPPPATTLTLKAIEDGPAGTFLKRGSALLKPTRLARSIF